MGFPYEDANPDQSHYAPFLREAYLQSLAHTYNGAITYGETVRPSNEVVIHLPIQMFNLLYILSIQVRFTFVTSPTNASQ